MAISIHSNRPGLDVRIASPEGAERELEAFRPHLLVHNDTAPIPAEALAGVPCRMEVLYSDSMGATVSAGGRPERMGDASARDLLGIVDRAAETAVAEGTRN